MVFTQYSNLASVLEKKCSSKMCIQQQQQKMGAGGVGGGGRRQKRFHQVLYSQALAGALTTLDHGATWKTVRRCCLCHPPFTSQSDSSASLIFSVIVFISERGVFHTTLVSQGLFTANFISTDSVGQRVEHQTILGADTVQFSSV